MVFSVSGHLRSGIRPVQSVKTVGRRAPQRREGVGQLIPQECRGSEFVRSLPSTPAATKAESRVRGPDRVGMRKNGAYNVVNEEDFPHGCFPADRPRRNHRHRP